MENLVSVQTQLSKAAFPSGEGLGRGFGRSEWSPHFGLRWHASFAPSSDAARQRLPMSERSARPSLDANQNEEGLIRKTRQNRRCNSRFPIPHSLRTQRANGFTLLEMLVVIALIGLATVAVSVSVTSGLASARVRAASSELAGALRATRAQAIVQSREQVFDVDTRSNSYDGVKHRIVILPKGLELSITSAREDRPNDHTGRIRFFPDGSSTGGRITLKSGQREWHVNVSWLTGEVRVVDTVVAR